MLTAQSPTSAAAATLCREPSPRAIHNGDRGQRDKLSHLTPDFDYVWHRIVAAAQPAGFWIRRFASIVSSSRPVVDTLNHIVLKTYKATKGLRR